MTTEVVDGRPARRERRLRGALLREPALHFALIGGFLYIAMQVWSPADGASRDIVIDAARLSQLAAGYRAQFGSAPEPGRLRRLAESYAEDEMLYREGLALGVDREDEVVRRRIVQKMRFLTEDRVTVPEPGEAELTAFWQARRDRFTLPATVSLTHVFFSADSGDAAAQARARRVLAQLSRSGATRAPERGDSFPGPSDLAGLSPDEAERLFGQSELSSALTDLPEGRWSGPLRSRFGWHLVRISARQPARVPPLQEVRDQVRRAWIDDARTRANAQAMAALRARYRLEVAPAP
jgi:hypothetical protein